MLTHIERYHRPSDVAGAWQLLIGDGSAVRVLGGGTDLTLTCPPEVRELVDLADAGLRYLHAEEGEPIRIGAMTTFTELLEAPALAAHASGVMHDMLAQVGSVLHRNSATIGGHIARGRLSDVIPVLLALDARVVTHDGEDHEEALNAYYARPRDPHLVVEVSLPVLPDRSAAAFRRFSRAAFDHAMVAGCCRVDLGDDGIADARVVVGETAVLGRRLEAAEETLRGRPLDGATIRAAVDAARETIDTRGDWIATADFRRHLAGVAVERCLVAIGEDLDGGRS